VYRRPIRVLLVLFNPVLVTDETPRVIRA